jgi:replicative DNA helicase
MQDDGTITRIGGIPAFSDRTANPPAGVQLAGDIERVLALASLRTVANCARAAIEIAESPDAGDLAGRLDQIMPYLRTAQEAGSPTNARDMAAIAEAAACDMEADRASGIPGPFPEWDQAAGALRPGELATLAARPGNGKTALALQHATACLRAGERCLFFSLEMTGEELCSRLARQALGVAAAPRDLAAWIRTNLAPEKNLSIYDGGAGSSLAQIESRSRLHAAHPRGLGLIVIDYLQLVAPPADVRRENRERQVATISRALKLLALELRVPILLCAQLNRESEKEDRRPRLTDLRESGAIEQDSDAVWFLHADRSGPKVSDADQITIVLSQAKRRAGPPGVGMQLTFLRPAVSFVRPQRS